MQKFIRSVGVFLFLLAAFPAVAGDVKVIGHFENGGVVAEINTYTDGDVVVAVIALKASGKTITFAFDSNEWPALERLWDSAKQESGAEYVSFGSLAEKGTTEKCVITAAGGPTVRLTVVSPIDGALVFDVSRDMVSDFDASLNQAASVTTTDS